MPFTHHQIPLFSPPAPDTQAGGKPHFNFVKEACQSAEKINRVLKLACRYETAFITDSHHLFDSDPKLSKAQNLVWDTIQNSRQLQWIISTATPESITQSLPSSWLGKGFENVTFALTAESDHELAKNIDPFRLIPARHWALLLTNENLPLHPEGLLNGIDWIVFTGTDTDKAADIKSLCLTRNTAFLFHRTDTPHPQTPETEPNNFENSTSTPPAHPFGNNIQLDRPTLPNLSTETSTSPLKPKHLTPQVKTIMKETSPQAQSQAATNNPPRKSTSQPLKHHKNPLPSQTKNKRSNLPSCADQQDFKKLDTEVREGLKAFIKAGEALTEIRDRKLWKAGGFKSWAAYCEDIEGFSKVHCNRLIKAFKIAAILPKVKPIGSTCKIVTPQSESQLRPLSKLNSDEERVQAWENASTKTDGQPTQKDVNQAVIDITSSKSTSPQMGHSDTPDLKVVASEFLKLREAVHAKKTLSINIENLITYLEKHLKIA